MLAMEIPECGPWNVSREAYFADVTRVSHHALLDFERSIPYFAGRYVTGTIPAPEPSAAMKRGSAFDCFLLEPEAFGGRYALAPEGIDRRTSRGKAEWADFEAARAGRELVTAADYNLLQAMRAGVLANPHARRALEAPGRVQQPVVWTCPATGMARKGLPDKVLTNGLVIDLKSLATEFFGQRLPIDAALAKATANYLYHLQAATYLEGCWEALRADGPFVLIGAAKEPPHECIVAEIEPDALALARRHNLRLLEELAGRRRTGDWSGRCQGKIQTIALPKWAYAREATS